jgi:hypothetical protein
MKKMHVGLDLATPSSRDPRWNGENSPLYVLVDHADGEHLLQKMDKAYDECLRQKMDEIERAN